MVKKKKWRYRWYQDEENEEYQEAVANIRHKVRCQGTVSVYQEPSNSTVYDDTPNPYLIWQKEHRAVDWDDDPAWHALYLLWKQHNITY